MSKLDELIKELCPDGVECKKIKDVFQRLKGTPITAGKMKEIETPDGKIKVFAGGTVKSIPMGELKKTIISVPPLEEQQRIVSILDRFDALCNDISNGLPAEIEARQKQYEYYRDKLLSFNEM